MARSTTKPATLAAVVLAAGKGTRMRSATAKVLHPLGGRPLAYYPVRAALDAGASPVVVVVGHQAEAVEAALSAALPGAPLRFARQAEQRGTAHAVLAARAALADVDGPIAILSGDTPLLTASTLARVVAARAATSAPLAFGTMTLEAPEGYGRVVRDARRRPARIVEERDASAKEKALREANAGLYCAEAAFLWRALDRIGSGNAQGEFYLTDLVALAVPGAGQRPAGRKGPARGVRGAPWAVAVPVDPLEATGVNDREELARAGAVLQRRRASAFMKAGVTIEAPDRFLCDEGVALGEDVTVEPDVRLRGTTRVGRGVLIGQGSVLADVIIGDGVTIRPYTVVEGPATVGQGAILGPFSRLRPGSELGENVHVGNFVEIKKSRLGQGAKASHLTYLGDAVVGAGVNVGAGTITCNYDGEQKHQTRIGDGAFIGSDAILVAPIEIGAGAYVAAGSTLTEDVPPGALALGRARQETKPGWVAGLRARRAARAAASPAPETSPGPAPGGQKR